MSAPRGPLSLKISTTSPSTNQQLKVDPTIVSCRGYSNRLSLAIPSSTTSNMTGKIMPALSKLEQTNGTPIRTTRPKLSLKLGTDTKRSFATGGSFSFSRLSCSETSDDDEDNTHCPITAKNTATNITLSKQQISEDLYNKEIQSTTIYISSPSTCTRSILKRCRSSSVQSQESAHKFVKLEDALVSSKSVSFNLSPVIINAASLLSLDGSEDEGEEEQYVPQTPVDDYEDSLSPPSTTSSIDSEESESDNELKTPVDDSKCSSNDRWATALQATSNRWRKPERQWVWTLGKLADRGTQVEPQSSSDGVQVWDEGVMAV